MFGLPTLRCHGSRCRKRKSHPYGFPVMGALYVSGKQYESVFIYISYAENEDSSTEDIDRALRIDP